MMQKQFLLLFSCTLFFLQCKKSENTAPSLQFQFVFDADQERLNNIGQPAVMPAGHAGQTPDFKQLSVHYIEFSPSAITPLGGGAIVYKAPEVVKNGENAVDFAKAAVSDEGKVFATISLDKLPPGTYQYVRASVTYQNYEIAYNIHNIPVIGDLNQQKGAISSFVGFNTYIGTVTPHALSLAVNDAKKQGFWVFETELAAPYDAYNRLISGQAPAGATTVVNPLFGTSDIPPGSCVVTGELDQPLVITGNETGDIRVTLSFSINKSLEWIDLNGNNQLDFYADDPTQNEQIVDMGLRGLKVSVQ